MFFLIPWIFRCRDLEILIALFIFAGFHEFIHTYMWVTSGSCSSLSAAASMGRICFVSSGLRNCNFASLMWFFYRMWEIR